MAASSRASRPASGPTPWTIRSTVRAGPQDRRDRQPESASGAGNENRDRQAEAMPPTSCTAPRRRSTACPALRAALRVDRQAAPADTPANAGNPVSLRQHPQRRLIGSLLGMKEGAEGRAPPQKDPSRERHGIEAGPKPARRSTGPAARAKAKARACYLQSGRIEGERKLVNRPGLASHQRRKAAFLTACLRRSVSLEGNANQAGIEPKFPAAQKIAA